jgi:archaellum biogenesis ATPase FlaH
MNRLEITILRNLVHNDAYMRKVLPFLKEAYFTDDSERNVYNTISDFITKYNKTPTVEALGIALLNASLPEAQFKENNILLQQLKEYEEPNTDWLTDETEKFCKDKAVYNAILQSIGVLEGRDKNVAKDGIPSLLQEALGVCFDSSVGHDYFDDSSDRFDFYHRIESRIPFDLSYFNKITNGGIPNKTLNICLAGTGVGKSLFMCHMAAACLAQGRNVLYITMEMAEERIAERIDSNLLNVEIDQLTNLSKEMFESRIKKVNDKFQGKLIIKEYPTASAHTGHFKSLLNELSLKRTFKPDIIFIDYLNICASSRFKPGGGVNSYTYIKAIAEELRGLAVEFNVPIMSATQTTRSGYSNTDVELTDTSESFGLPATADFMFALISTEELENLNQLMVKQLKNRYNDPTLHKRFMVGIDRAKMRLYDLEPSAQTGLADIGKIEEEPEQSNFNKIFNTKNKKDYSSIKV